MITLFHCMGARSFRPLWVLEELGLPYELRMLPFPPRQHAREYLSVNPLGTVPALLDGEVAMTESAAMCEYLCSKNGPTRLSIQPGHPQYGPYLNWLHFGEATLTFPQAIVLRYGRFEPPQRRVPQVAADYSKWFLSRAKGLLPPLLKNDYLCGDELTAADISVGYALMLAGYLGLGDQLPPQVRAYWERLQTGSGYQRALAAQLHAAHVQGVHDTPAPLTSPE